MDTSSSLVSDSVSASSTPHTRPGGENPVKKDIYTYFDHLPAHLSGPKVAEKNITTAAAVDHPRQAERLQNMLVRIASNTGLPHIFFGQLFFFSTAVKEMCGRPGFRLCMVTWHVPRS